MPMSPVAKRTSRLLSLALILILPFVLWTQRWDIYDYLRLRGYQPPAEIAQLAGDVSFNDSSRRLFYVYHPSLEGKGTFNQHCKLSEKTIVLGCYVTGKGIYLYDVTDERLAGVEQVTAAHEMLHAAYDRLSSKEREQVNGWLEQALSQLANERIKTTVEEYRQNGADVNNELHSILGTEVRSLPPELEAYYGRYFANRLKVVEYSEKYEQVFTERKQKIAELDERLTVLKAQIDGLQADVEARSGSLQSERAKLDNYAASGNTSAYNAAVPGYNASVSAYNAKVRELRRLIDSYNTLVAQRNAIVLEESELIKAIDSRPNTLETQ